MCTKFQVDWTFNYIKNYLDQNINLKWDRNDEQANGRTGTQTGKHNAPRLGIKTWTIY